MNQGALEVYEHFQPFFHKKPHDKMAFWVDKYVRRHQRVNGIHKKQIKKQRCPVFGCKEEVSVENKDQFAMHYKRKHADLAEKGIDFSGGDFRISNKCIDFLCAFSFVNPQIVDSILGKQD